MKKGGKGVTSLFRYYIRKDDSVRKHLNTLLAGAALIALPLVANAGPTYTFSTSEGVQPSDVGVITLTQIDGTTVDVLVDSKDTNLPSPQ